MAATKDDLISMIRDEQQRLTDARERVADLSARRNRLMARAYAMGVNIPEQAAALGMSAEAVSKILGRPGTVTT